MLLLLLLSRIIIVFGQDDLPELCIDSAYASFIELKPFIDSNLQVATYHDYCSIPFIHLVKTQHNTSLLIMQVDLGADSFENLEKLLSVKICTISVVVRIQNGIPGKYRVIENQKKSIEFQIEHNQSITEFGLRKKYSLNEKLDVRFVDVIRNKSVTFDTVGSYTITCVR